MIRVLFTDGPYAGRLTAVPSLHPITLIDRDHDYLLLTYHIHLYGLHWVFPDWGRFVQWELKDLHWARPLCRVAPEVIQKTWYLASLRQPDVRDANEAMKRIAPEVCFQVQVPRGFVLATDDVFSTSIDRLSFG
jgi:hypothetical protein